MTDRGSDATNQIVSIGIEAGTIEAAVDTLDAICSGRSTIPKVIKIDVEGHEPEVLEGASRCLRGALARIIENGDRSTVRRIMSVSFMRGPYFYSHRLCRLSTQPPRFAEDSIYIGTAFEAEYPHILVTHILVT